MLKIKCRKCKNTEPKEAINIEYLEKNNKKYVKGQCKDCNSKFHRFCKKENNIEMAEPLNFPLGNETTKIEPVEVKQKTKKVKQLKELIEVKN